HPPARRAALQRPDLPRQTQEIAMRDSKGRFPPERQRRFDRAFREIERIGRGRAGSVHEIGDVHRGAVEPAEVERVRWLLVAMAHARGTPGSLAIAALARRGYTIG